MFIKQQRECRVLQSPLFKPATKAVGSQATFWSFVVPLSATLIFASCANNKQTLKSDEADKMPYAEMTASETGKRRTALPEDTLRATPVKLKEGFVSQTAKKDTLLANRLKELKDELWKYLPPTPERGKSSGMSPEKAKEMAAQLVYNTTEQMIYSSAIKGDLAAVKKYSDELLKFAELRGETAKGEEILRKFNAIMEMK